MPGFITLSQAIPTSRTQYYIHAEKTYTYHALVFIFANKYKCYFYNCRFKFNLLFFASKRFFNSLTCLIHVGLRCGFGTICPNGQSISISCSDRCIDLDVARIAPSSPRCGNHALRVLFFFFFLLSPQRQRIRSRSAVLQNAPRGDVVLVRLYEEISRENVRSECGGKGGFPCTHPSYTRHPPPLSASLSFSFSVYPFQVGGAANQSFLREHDGRRRWKRWWLLKRRVVGWRERGGWIGCTRRRGWFDRMVPRCI